MKKLIVALVMVAALVVPAIVSADATLVVGDVSLDGKTNIGDAVQIMQYTVGLRAFDADQLRCGDTTADGLTNIGDAIHIMQWTVDPYGIHGILKKPLYDPVFHASMVDPLTV